MNSVKQFFPIISLAFLSSCALYTYDPSIKGDAPCCPNTEWIPPCQECAFPDMEKEDSDSPSSLKGLTVPQILDLALRNNPATKQAWANARAAGYSLAVAKSALYPTISGQGTVALTNQVFSRQNFSLVNNNNSDVPRQNPYFTYFDRSLMISYLLLDFGGRDSNIESARQALYALDWTHNRTIQQVMQQVWLAFYNYLNIKASIQAKEMDIKDSQTALDAAEAQHKAGINTKVDVLQAKSNLINNEMMLVNFKGQLNIALGAIAVAIGIPSGIEFDLQDLPDEIPIEKISGDVEHFVEIAKANRPDFASAYATLLQSRENFWVARSAIYPTLTANVSLDKTTYSSGINQSHNYTSSITLNIPFYNGFLYLNQAREAREQIKVALAKLEATEAVVTQDVLTSYYTFKTSLATLTYSEEYLQYSQEAYDAAIARYKHGTGSILEVLTALATLSNARTQRIQSKTQWMTAVTSLAYSTGTLEIPDEDSCKDYVMHNWKSDFEEEIKKNEPKPSD